MTVSVYKTSVQTSNQVKELKPKLDKLLGIGNWNFALDDTDRIFRVVSTETDPALAVAVLNRYGFNCLELED